MSTNDHLLAGPFALDAIEDDEHEAFDDHLTGCVSCRLEVAEFRETAALLAEGVAEPVPVALLDRVMDQIRATPQLPPLVDEDHRIAPPDPTTGATGPSDAPGATTGGDTAKVVRLRSRARWILAAAAMVAIIVGAAIATTVVAQSGRIDNQIAAQIGPGWNPYQLTGDHGLNAQVRVGTQTDRAAIVAEGLPQLPPDKVYELWFIDDTTAHPATTFRPDADGNVVQVFDRPVDRTKALGVTVEPAPGSPSPTLPIVMQATT